MEREFFKDGIFSKQTFQICFVLEISSEKLSNSDP